MVQVNLLTLDKTSQIDYIREHLRKAQEALDRMEVGLDSNNAMIVIDGLSSLQWQERSLVDRARSVMEQVGFNESDLGIRPLMDYRDEER
jgi:hypothetical protein